MEMWEWERTDRRWLKEFCAVLCSDDTKEAETSTAPEVYHDQGRHLLRS